MFPEAGSIKRTIAVSKRRVVLSYLLRNTVGWNFSPTCFWLDCPAPRQFSAVGFCSASLSALFTELSAGWSSSVGGGFWIAVSGISSSDVTSESAVANVSRSVENAVRCDLGRCCSCVRMDL